MWCCFGFHCIKENANAQMTKFEVKYCGNAANMWQDNETWKKKTGNLLIYLPADSGKHTCYVSKMLKLSFSPLFKKVKPYNDSTEWYNNCASSWHLVNKYILPGNSC